MTGSRAEHLVSAVALRHRPTMESTVILDVRVDALGRPDHDAHLRGHIPTARFVDLDVDLSGTVGPRSGARPLPEIDQLRASLRRWGITPATPVVVHDDSTSAAAARAWWVLRWAGVRDVRLLDGGLRSWIDAGGDIARGPRTAPRPVLGASRAIRPRPGELPVVEIDDIVEVTRRAVLLDARPAEHFAGREGGAAHIPGAISAPVFDDFDDHGRLRPADELAARYRSLGVDLRRASPDAERADVVAATYCSSGVAAALQVLVLATLGVSAALYPGSLSQWISDPARLTVGSAITPRPTADIA